MTISDSYNRIFNLTGLHATQLVTCEIAEIYHEYNARKAGEDRNRFYKSLIDALKARIEELGPKATYLGMDFDTVREALFYLFEEVGAEEMQVEEKYRLACANSNSTEGATQVQCITEICIILGIGSSVKEWAAKYSQVGAL